MPFRTLRVLFYDAELHELLASNLIVALSSQFWLTLTGRVLLGFALKGFWTMSL